jgi:GDP-mannose transporter
MQDGIIIAAYMLVSSTLLVVNKLAVDLLPEVAVVLTAQVVSATCVSLALCLRGPNLLTCGSCLAYAVPAGAFLACLVANIKVLQLANVETLIVFRSTTPLLLCVCEWLYLDRQLPSARSTVCLTALFAASAVYAHADSDLSVKAAPWLIAWYLLFCFNQLYGKAITDRVDVRTNWERVLYMNGWSSVLLLAYDLAFDLPAWRSLADAATRTGTDMTSLSAVAVSCAIGIGMSYFTMECRRALSATAFTVVGNACKVLSVLLSILVWQRASSVVGTAALFVCLTMAALYKQPPLRQMPAGTERDVLIHCTS